jgi:hypothetical protein
MRLADACNEQEEAEGERNRYEQETTSQAQTQTRDHILYLIYTMPGNGWLSGLLYTSLLSQKHHKRGRSHHKILSGKNLHDLSCPAASEAQLLALAQCLRVLALKLIWRDGDGSVVSLTGRQLRFTGCRRHKCRPYSLWPDPRTFLTPTLEILDARHATPLTGSHGNNLPFWLDEKLKWTARRP